MKEQWMKVTTGSKLLAAYYGIIAAIERISGEADVSPLEYYVGEEVLDATWIQGGIESGKLVVEYNGPREGLEEVEDEIEIGGRTVTLQLTPVRELMGVPLTALYETAPEKTLRSDSPEFKRLAFETTRSGIEYMSLYLDDGRILFLEGEYLRVSLPFVRAAGSVHTHPEGSCMLSLKDLESGLDLLAEGGLFEAVATISCSFIMYRIGLVTEDDYFRVKEAILKARGGGLERPIRLDSIKFYSLSY